MNNGTVPSEKANLLIFEDTLSQCLSDPDILESILYARDHFRIYREPINCVDLLSPDALKNVIFVNCSSTEAVRLVEYVSSSKTAVLDFASATTPGGGTLVGSRGQEEDLCRLSSLYLVLNTDKLKAEYYIPNKAAEAEKAGALDHDITAVYLPQIRILKEPSAIRIPTQRHSCIDIIVCAAPNLRNRTELDEMQLEELVYKRACRIFECAIQNQCKNIVLGAHGCGAFRNPVSVVGKAYSKATKEYISYFDAVLFAIPDKNKFELLSNFFENNNKELRSVLHGVAAVEERYFRLMDYLEEGFMVPGSEYRKLLRNIDAVSTNINMISGLPTTAKERLTEVLDRVARFASYQLYTIDPLYDDELIDSLL